MDKIDTVRAELAAQYDQQFQQFKKEYLSQEPLDRARSLCDWIATDAVTNGAYSVHDIEGYLNWAMTTYLTNVHLDVKSYGALRVEIPSIVEFEFLQKLQTTRD